MISEAFAAGVRVWGSRCTSLRFREAVKTFVHGWRRCKMRQLGPDHLICKLERLPSSPYQHKAHGLLGLRLRQPKCLR